MLRVTNLFEEGSEYFTLKSFHVGSSKCRLVSFYRLDFGEIGVEGGDNHISHILIRGLFCSQCVSMKNGWEFLPREKRESVFEPVEYVNGRSGLNDGIYSTKELQKCV